MKKQELDQLCEALEFWEQDTARARRERRKSGEYRARITLTDWYFRLNMMMVAVLGRTTSSFCDDWKWAELYHDGFTPGEVVEAIVEEFRELGVLQLNRDDLAVN